MVFSGIPFLFYFLPCALALYYIAPRRLKNAVLLLESLVFYAWGEPKYVVFMLLCIAQGYVSGLVIDRNRGKRAAKAALALSVVLSLGLLCYFKYADFFLSSFAAATGLSVKLLGVALPIGISFYTFQMISYTADVYRGAAAQRSFVSLAAYIAMFPQLVAGPIVRYSDIAPELGERRVTLLDAAYGVRRFILGLAKKVLIANVLGELCSAFKASGEQSVLFAWLYAAAVTLQIYYDFSGYSDMAIGLGRLLGFRFPENFEHPLASMSMTEFWRRWHISLGSWFRDYVYIPLGGSRRGKARQLRNILVVWLLTGLWHGAAWNFVAWGGLFAVLLMAEKLWLLPVFEKKRALGHAYVLLFAALSFVLFDADSIAAAWKTIMCMLGLGGLPAASAEAVYCLRSYAVVLAAAAVGAAPWVRSTALRLKQSARGEKIINALEPAALVLLLAVSTAYLVDGSFNPFLYFRF